MNPLSGRYYVTHNKGRVLILVIMTVLASFSFLMGNFVESCTCVFDKSNKFNDKLCIIEGAPDSIEDFNGLRQSLVDDSSIEFIDYTGYGYFGLEFKNVLGIMMSGSSYSFFSVEDCKTIFDHIGINVDLSNVKDGDIILSDNIASQYNLKEGDIVDKNVEEAFGNDSHRLSAISEDSSYMTYYITSDGPVGRYMVFSKTMEGDELYNYVRNLVGDLNVRVIPQQRAIITQSLSIFNIVFYLLCILIGTILAVTVNSVTTGQYLKRMYEFGVYNALGIKRSKICLKIVSEIMIINAISLVSGFILMEGFTYLINELYYHSHGYHLVYSSIQGLSGLLLCEILILIPMIISKCKMAIKSDVTLY